MLLNDMARCMGSKDLRHNVIALCDRRETCARYLERGSGGPRTPHHPYLCDDEGDMFIPVEKDGKTTENL